MHLHAARRVRRMPSAVGGVGKPALRRTKASSPKTHTLPENARALWIHLRKETHFTFIGNHLLEETPASSLGTSSTNGFCLLPWHSRVCVCLFRSLWPPSKSYAWSAIKLCNKEMKDNFEAIYKTVSAIRALTRVCLSDWVSGWKGNKFLKH